MLYHNSLVPLPHRPALLCRFQARLTNKISGVILDFGLNEGWRQYLKEEDEGDDGEGNFGLPGQKFAIAHNISPNSFGKDSSVLIGTIFLWLIIDRILLGKKMCRLLSHLSLGFPHVVLIWFHWFAIIIVWLTIFELSPKWYPSKIITPSLQCLLCFFAFSMYFSKNACSFSMHWISCSERVELPKFRHRRRTSFFIPLVVAVYWSWLFMLLSKVSAC